MNKSVLGGLGLFLVFFASTAVAKKDWMEPCPSGEDNETHRYVQGLGQGDEVEAIRQARYEAKAQLIRDLCGEPCDALMKVAFTSKIVVDDDWYAYRRPKKGEEQGSACASVAIRKTEKNTLPRQITNTQLQLEALADRIERAAGDQPVAIQEPRWSNNCGTGQLGAAIQGQISSRLSGVGTVPLIEAVRGGQNARMLQLELAPGVSITPSLLDPTSGARKTVEGMNISPALFGLEDGVQGDCRGELVEGLQQGLRLGRDGLVVTVDSGAEGGVAQHLQQITTQLVSNQAARVWLFSVHSDGRGYLVWPRAGDSGQVDEPQSIPMLAIDLPSMGDEMLVAVGLPAGSQWSEAASWRGTCRIPGQFEDLSIPASAAVGTATFTVTPAAPGAPQHPNEEDVLRKLREYDENLCFEPSETTTVE